MSGRLTLKGWFAMICLLLVIFASLFIHKETSWSFGIKALVIAISFLVSGSLFFYYAITDQSLEIKTIKKQQMP